MGITAVTISPEPAVRAEINAFFIAIGNSDDKSLINCVDRLLNDNSILVRVAAIWALSKLSKESFLFEMNQRIKFEKSKEVINEWMESKAELNGN